MENKTENVKENKMATMPINKLLISMALPMMISMLVQALYNIVDSVFVAKINQDAFAAISLVFPLQAFMISMGGGIAVGTNAILSRYLGAKDLIGVKRSALNGIFLSLIVYFIFLFIGIFGVKGFMEFQPSTPATIKYGTDYLSVICICSFGIFSQMMFERLLQSTGKTIFSMITQMTGAIINIILDPILIFGLLGAPRLEMKGAAIATVIGQCCAGALALFFNLKYNKEIPFSLKGFRPNMRTIKKILYIGVPSIIMASMGSVMTLGMNQIFGTFKDISQTVISVFGAYFKLQSFIFMPVFGLNNGMVPIVAFSLGARNKERLMKTIKLSMFYAFLLMLIGFIIFQTLPAQLLTTLFDADENMLAVGVPALRTISFHFLLACFSIIMLSVFQALGNGIFSMFISFVRQLIVLLPVAYLLSLLGNVNYIWYAFVVAECVAISLALIALRHMNKTLISKL